MRTISPTLEAAQKAATIDALVKVYLSSGGTNYTYTRTRILDIEEREDGELQSCEITLSNSDGALTSLDLRGFQAVISTGAVTGSGDEYSACAPMWVVAQRFDSWQGHLTCILSLQGVFKMMAEDKASASYIPEDTDTKSVKTLINEILGATMTCFSHCTAYTVEWDTGYDDLADTYIPKDAFRVYAGGDRKAAFDRLMEYTANVVRVRNDSKIHIFKPTTTGVVYDYEYALTTGHTFFAKALRNRLVIPNYIVVKSRPDDTPQYSGYAQDAESYALLPKRDYKMTKLASNDQATAIAEALLARAKMWCEAGSGNVPNNVGAEAFDYVKVTDERESDSRVGNIGQLIRHYTAEKNEWRMTFVFGNWQSVRKVLANLNITSDEVENYFSRLSVGDLYVEHILADSLDMVWIDPEGNIDLDKIGDNLDNLPDGEVYARIKSMHLDAGVLQLDEHVVYKADYNPTEKFDLGDDTLDNITNGTVYSRVKTAALSAEGLILLDQVQIGDTWGLISKTYISAGQLYLSSVIQDSSNRVVSDSEKSTWNGKTITFGQAAIPTSVAVGDLWMDTDDKNKIYRAACIGANEIKAGEWEIVRDTDIAQALADAATAIANAATAQSTADSKIITFYQASIPTSTDVGDFWIDTDDKNKLYRAAIAGANEIKAGEWEIVRDTDIQQALTNAATAQATADSKIVTFYQAAIPTSTDTGDLWVDTDDSNKLYRAGCVGANEIKAGEWELVVNPGAVGALVFRQTTAPTSGMKEGDIWIDTDNGDAPYTYSGSTWVAAYTSIQGGNIVTGTIEASKLTFTPYIIGIDDLDDVANGVTYGKILTADLQAGHIKLSTCYGTIDDLANGTYAKVLTADLSGGHLLLSSVVQSSSYRTVTDSQKTDWTSKMAGDADLDDIANGSTYGRVKLTDISSGHILLSTCVGDLGDLGGSLDDIANGATYARVLATDLSSGHIKLTSSVVASGKWYDYGSIEIDASTGINITGTGGLTIYYGATDEGSIYGGLGAFNIDSTDDLKLMATDRVYIQGAWIEMGNSEYMDFPEYSSYPTAHEGRGGYYTTEGRFRFYDAGAWRTVTN